MEGGNALKTGWEATFEKLTPNARNLHSLLMFFDPNEIQEWLLTNTKAQLEDSRLEFLTNEINLGDAVEQLNKSSFITCLATTKSISMNRSIDIAGFDRLTNDDQPFFFDSAVRLLGSSFPNTWKHDDHTQGHGWQSWETCNTVLPHINHLIGIETRHGLHSSDEEAFAELIFRGATYLWEKEQPSLARELLDHAFSLNIDPDSAGVAQAQRLLGHIALDMARPRAALEAYEKALTIRVRLSGPSSLEVAPILDSIACSYTEIGDTPAAFQFLDRATSIHIAHDPDSMMARTKAIWAVAYLRANQPKESLQALQDCWSMQEKTQLEIEESHYPKHSGDIMLLARIQHALGRSDAMQLAAQAMSMRKRLLGDRGPRVADSMFILARMLEDEGETVLAAKLLSEIINMSRGELEMKGHSGRAHWYLSRLKQMMGETGEAEELRKRAKAEKEGIEGREGPDEESDAAYMSLVGWMLW